MLQRACTAYAGWHLYFRAPVDCTIGSISGGRTALGPEIDICGSGRRSGGYLIGPGTVIEGRLYVIARDVPVAPLPDWIADRINTPSNWREPSRRLGETGKLRSDKNQLEQDLRETLLGLETASHAAEQLYAGLNRAHSGLGPIGYQD